MLEVTGEALEQIEGRIRVVCNCSLPQDDIELAKGALAAMRHEWCGSRPENLCYEAKPRFKRLYNLLRSRKMQICVLSDEVFGLIHDKAGLITLADGRRTSFLGSVNESRAAFRLNYELVWEHDSPEAMKWVEEESAALWFSPLAVGLAEFIVQDSERMSRRRVVGDLDKWREDPDPESAVIETPVYRSEVGLREHQR